MPPFPEFKNALRFLKKNINKQFVDHSKKKKANVLHYICQQATDGGLGMRKGMQARCFTYYHLPIINY